MKAINRYIIVENIKTEPKKVAGLIMTDNTDVDNRYFKAKIISFLFLHNIHQYLEQVKFHNQCIYHYIQMKQAAMEDNAMVRANECL